MLTAASKISNTLFRKDSFAVDVVESTEQQVENQPGTFFSSGATFF